MSRNVKNTTATRRERYCKVCHDAGKPESEYTSHWVRSLPDRSGKTTVTCPTLLSTECRYCYKLGHTAKFCPVLEQQKKDKDRAERIATRKEAELPKKEPKKMVSSFDALRQDSDSDEEIEVSKDIKPVIEEFPVLGAATKKIEVDLPRVQPEVKTGWAAALAKPKETESARYARELEERSMTKLLPQSALRQQPVVVLSYAKPEPKDYTKEIYTRSWADWTDSDTEDDEPEPVKQVVADDYDSDW